MANIPTYGGQQVTPSIMGYRPMSDSVPNVPAMGLEKGLEKASNRLDRMFTKFLDEQDDARVTDAMTKLRRKAIDLQVGEGGWASQLGENALKPDEEGNSLIQRTDRALEGYSAELSRSLTPRQLRKYQKQAAPVLATNHGSVAQHFFQQGIESAKSSHLGAIESYVESGSVYATSPDRLQESAKGIEESANKLGGLLGWAPEQIENTVRKNQSAMYMNGIVALMSGSDRNPQVAFTALGVLQANSKYMSASDIARARAMINPVIQAHEDAKLVEGATTSSREAQSQSSENYADVVQILGTQKAGTVVRGFHLGILPAVSAGGHQSMPADMSGGSPETFRYGASQLTVGQAMEAAKMLDRPWDVARFKTDANYNMALGLAWYESIYKRRAGDQQLALAEYLSSQKAVDDALALQEGMGGVWTDYLPKDVQAKLNVATKAFDTGPGITDPVTGEKISALSPAYASRAKRWTTPDEFREYFKRQSPRAAADPVYLERMVNSALSQQEKDKRTYDEEHNYAKLQVLETLASNGGVWEQVPPSMYSKLTVPEVLALRDRAADIAKGVLVSDPEILGKLDDDNYLAGLDRTSLELALKALNSTDANTIKRRWSRLRTKAVADADARNAELKRAEMGIVDDAYDPSSADVERALAQVEGYETLKSKNPAAAKLYALAFRRELGIQGQLAGAKIKGVSAELLASRVAMNLVTPDSLFASGKPAIMLKLNDLPNTSRTDATSVIEKIANYWVKQQGYDREATDMEKQTVLTRIMMTSQWAPLPFVVPPDTFDEAMMDRVKTAYAAIHGKDKEMPMILQLQGYIIGRVEGKKGKDPDVITSMTDSLGRTYDIGELQNGYK